ncbi:hypothetical protein K7887_18480 [Sutcliffiella horikoshii]|uniref:replicative helicase loader/inhibitor n=1 Tax=Sutcliffiella horikoshii TaxID=79883 RepID=UPI001CBADFFB|nr:replicative helicase loader/inhibitor [Sutcliffiella horikoshii]UAL46828.1 hypothetical protein K7887_18480 [Sutcliffiella horikoshii]
MTEEQSLEILEHIAAAYDHFKLSEKRVNVWSEQLKNMDFKGVLHNLNKHIGTKKFPPTIADIAAKLPEKNKFLEEQKDWRQEVQHARASGNQKTFMDYLSPDIKAKYQPLIQEEK